MALTFGFYNSLNGDRKYNAEQFGSIFDGVINDGVYMAIGNQMVVQTANYGFQVNIQTGRAWFLHTWTLIDTPYALTLPSPEVLLDKWVAVVLDINKEQSYRRNTITYVEGTPDANPQWPSLINTSTRRQVPLAFVLVRAGSSVISQADIWNAVGTDWCPFVTGIVQSMSLDPLIAQWRAQWDEWMIRDKNIQWNNMISADTNQWNAMITNDTNQWNTLIADKNSEWSTLISNKNSEWNTLISNKNSAWDTLISQKNTAWNTLIAQKNTAWANNLNARNAEFTSFMNTSRSEYNTFKTQYNTFYANANAQFNKFMEDSDQSFLNLLEYEDQKANDAIALITQEGTDTINEFRGSTEEFLDGQKAVWDDWFDHIQGQLSHDAATNLQKQIDSLAFATVIKRRAVLGITAYAVDNMVIFGGWGTKSRERVIVGAPTLTNPYVSGIRTIMGSLAASVDGKRVLVDSDWGRLDDETAIIAAPV